MIFTINTKTWEISVKGHKCKYALDDAQKEYWETLMSHVEQAGCFLDKEPTHVDFDKGSFVFGHWEKSESEEDEEDEDAPAGTFTEYFRFNISAAEFRDKIGQKICAKHVTASLQDCVLRPGAPSWIGVFYSFWKYVCTLNQKKSNALKSESALRNSSQRVSMLLMAERFLSLGFSTTVSQLHSLLAQVGADELAKNSGAPWTILNVPKTTFNDFCAFPECTALLSNWRAVDRVKEFGLEYWNRVWHEVRKDPVYIENFIRLIVQDNADELKELVENKNYEPARLIEYLFSDLPQKQGLTDAQSGCRILKDYAEMSSALWETYDKYPKYLKTAHDIAVSKYNNLKQDYSNSDFDSVYAELKTKHMLSYNSQYKDGSFRYEVRCPWKASEIAEEGRAMHHCVASYIGKLSSKCCILFVRYCDLHRSWSVSNFIRSLTIQVDWEENTIVQASGKLNRKPTLNEFTFLKEYCEAAYLDLSDSLKESYLQATGVIFKAQWKKKGIENLCQV